ncbi:hypothetical protein HD806DRAFT_530134 [Xylariaceae sp. AK1471]|nr:hypothetical protein HD806DRAFT_530134 [Xylariaceae sp. AK1471]
MAFRLDAVRHRHTDLKHKQTPLQLCLYRFHADLTEKSSSADSSEPRQATESGVAVEPLAQISVVANLETQSNYLFVAKHGGDNISSVTDNWAAQNESHHGLDMASTEPFKEWQARTLQEDILGCRLGNGHAGFTDNGPPHHHHHQKQHHQPQHHRLDGYSDGYTNGNKLLLEEDLIEKVAAKTISAESTIKGDVMIQLKVRSTSTD